MRGPDRPASQTRRNQPQHMSLYPPAQAAGESADRPDSEHPILELKAAAFTLPVIRLFGVDMDAVETELAPKVLQAPGFFRNTPVVIDLTALSDFDADVGFPQLVGLLRGMGMMPVGVRGGSPAQHEAAQAMELAILGDAHKPRQRVSAGSVEPCRGNRRAGTGARRGARQPPSAGADEGVVSALVADRSSGPLRPARLRRRWRSDGRRGGEFRRRADGGRQHPHLRTHAGPCHRRSEGRCKGADFLSGHAGRVGVGGRALSR